MRRVGDVRDPHRPFRGHHTLMTSVFLGYNALGDTLCTTPVLRAFRVLHPEHFIIYVVQNAPYCRVLDGNPDVDLVIYSEWLNQHGLTPFNQDWFDRLP